MKIFGSDGFRSKFGTKYMTVPFLEKFAYHFSGFCNNNSTLTPAVVIGRDTRESGKTIEDIFSKILSENGVVVHLAGILSTPALAYITKNNDFDYGIMITASHNPFTDNGVKIFSNSGFKLDAKSEQEIENNINRNLTTDKHYHKKEVTSNEDLILPYIKYLAELVSTDNFNYKFFIDCSYGSNSLICQKLFSNYSQFLISYTDFNGKNINLNCGSLEPDNLINQTIKSGCDFGVAFDGDGDRAIFCHKDIGIIPTEKIIFLFADQLFNTGLAAKSIVSTIISNKGLKENLNNIGTSLIETDLGDRLVVEKVIDSGSILGAETSGHFFFPQESTTMDGLLAFLKFILIVNKKSFSAEIFFQNLIHYDSVKKNISKEGVDLKAVREKLKRIINTDEKLIIRESMWDPVIRIYYNYNSSNRIKYLIRKINGEE